MPLALLIWPVWASVVVELQLNAVMLPWDLLDARA
jgi:hypothetical protein